MAEEEMIEDDLQPSEPTRQIRHDQHQREFMTRLICCNINPRELDDLLRVGVKLECFTEVAQGPLRWFLDYYRSTRSIPSQSQMLTQYPRLEGLCLVNSFETATIKESNVSLSGHHRAVTEAFFLKSLQEHFVHVAEQWDKNVPIDQLWNEIATTNKELARLHAISEQNAKTLSEAVEEVRKEYMQTKEGINWGIPLPFPFLNESLRGLQPAQLMTVVARPGVGKTWFLIMCACSAITGNPWLFTAPEKKNIILTAEDKAKFTANAKRVLFVSMEMPIADIAKRAIALLTKLRYPEMRAAKFTLETDEAVFFDALDELQQGTSVGSNMQIITANTPDQVAACADQFNADMVIVDGFYLMAGTGEKRWERVQDNLQQLRTHSLTTLRPYIIASQLAQKEDRLAFSQSVEQDSSIIIQLHQSLQEKNMKQIRIQTRKVREGVSDLQYHYNWDIDNMRFSEEGQYTQSFDREDA